MNRAKGLAKAAPWWWRFKDWMNLQKTKTSFPEETYSPYHISIYEIYTLYSNIYIYICIVIYYDRIFIVWERLSSWMWISFLANSDSQAFYLIIRDTIYFTTPGLPITIAEIRQISFASDMIWRCFAKIWNWSRHWDSLMTMRVTGWEMGLTIQTFNFGHSSLEVDFISRSQYPLVFGYSLLVSLNPCDPWIILNTEKDHAPIFLQGIKNNSEAFCVLM